MEVYISIVIPVFNSKDSLNELYMRLTESLSKITPHFEIILIDDNSKDSSYSIMKKLNEKDERVKVIQLMRNYGQHNAIMCGFNYAKGEIVITMDDDLQNPPEEISKLLRKMNEGYDIVIGKAEEKKHSFVKNLGSKMVGKAFGKVFNKPIELKMSSFRAIRKNIIESIIAVKSPNPMIDAILLSNTLNISNVDVQHDERKYGQSNYSLYKSYKLSLDLLVNYSTIPLQFISLNGFLFAIAGLLIAIFIVVGKIFGLINAAGWASIIALISIFSGMILMSFGIVGEYLIRIIKEASHFRQYSIRESSYDQSKEDHSQKMKDVV